MSRTKPLDNNYYELLGLSHDFKEEELKSAFREAAKTYHPDRNKDPDAPSKFQKVADAYATLKDPVKREAYNLEVGIIDLAQYSKTKALMRRRRLGGYWAILLGVVPAWVLMNTIHCLGYSRDAYQQPENRPKLGAFNVFLYARMWMDDIDLAEKPKRIVYLEKEHGIIRKNE